MSKGARPVTPKAVETSPPLTCAECKHWRPTDDDHGLCLAGPPDVVEKATKFGPLCRYRVTLATYPACGAAEK